ncbi:hypothetical protein LB518_15735 [Mesorhizobium sp. BR1-1-16]|uniref:hypothetical protein n=1 Tax=Mesorhizobium sp. BR1-1-16 TaxID=2876653 RepID=UPI001CCFF639|nr:hypothetical protein [Mesorhizobium sp. BR1-1-16]MBZ9937752.1 hypothetical protein [Mesorhizobium sp. BR1-1-16]
MASMVGDEMRQRRRMVLWLSIGIVAALSGCTTVKKTLDFSADPELQRKGAYPNINVGGAPQPGKPLTPEEQQKAKAALSAEGKVAGPEAGADAKKQGAERASELDALAKNHAAQTIEEIQNGCGTDKVIDATKCPQ